jgi:hypothetical protein
MPSIAAYPATTGVAGDTAFSPESGKFPYAFWQGIGDGVGDQNFPPILADQPRTGPRD